MNKTNLKQKNQRTCFVTRQKVDKKHLIRVCYNRKNQNYFISQTIQGRGVYFSQDINIIPIIIKKKMLHKAFRKTIPEDVYNKLVNKIKESVNEK